MQTGELPVRVSAAIAIKSLLAHEAAVNFLRPGLESLLRNYLKLMDEMDFDELVLSLKTIVEEYDEEIGPFAVALCQKLSEAYLKLLATKGQDDQEDQETSLTADGLISAIRRVFDSIQGANYKHLYPQLEMILEATLQATFTSNGKMYVEEGLAILTHLLYYQDQVSPRLWNFFLTLMDGAINNRDFIDGNFGPILPPIFNYINKGGEVMSVTQVNETTTYLDLLFQFIVLCFNKGEEEGDELTSVFGVSLTNALLDNIRGVDSILQSIIELFVKEITKAEVPEYKGALTQGICSCLHYNTLQTLSILEGLGCTE